MKHQPAMTSQAGRSTPYSRCYNRFVPHLNAGFTLIELMMVLMVIALASSLVSVSMYGIDSKARDEKDRLLVVLQHARNYAILNGRSVQIRPNADGDGYVFLELRAERQHSELSPPTEQDSIQSFANQEKIIDRTRPKVWTSSYSWEELTDHIALKSHKVEKGTRLEFFGLQDDGVIYFTAVGEINMDRIVVADEREEYTLTFGDDGKINAVQSAVES